MIVQNDLELAHIHRAILSGEPLERAVEREGAVRQPYGALHVANNACACTAPHRPCGFSTNSDKA